MTEKQPDPAFLRGFLTGIFIIAGLYGFFKGLDILVMNMMDRPLFTKPDALQLIVLSTLALLFRQRFKNGDFQQGSGLFLATFISVLGYLIYRKYNFAP